MQERDSRRDLNLTLADIEALDLDAVFKRVVEVTRIRIHGPDDWENAGRLLEHARDLADGRVTLLCFSQSWRCYFGLPRTRVDDEANVGWMPCGATAVEAICRAALCRMADIDPARQEVIPAGDPRA